MDLLRVGSVHQYVKNAARQTQWKLKQRSGDFTGHQTSLKDYVNVTKASSVLPRTDEQDSKLSGIMTKAQAGRKLSPDEWDYLKEKNPALYEKLKEIEREQESYEEALKRCKTRDEARRLHVSKLGEVLSAAKNGDESALYRLNRLTRTMTQFTKSEEYHRMPTEAEEAIEREREREEAEVREAEREAAPESGEAEAEREDVSGTDADADAEAVRKTEVDADAEAVDKRKVAADAEAVRKTEVDADAEAVRDRKVAAESVPNTADCPEWTAPAPVLSTGRRAYLNQRDGTSRRRTVEAKA